MTIATEVSSEIRAISRNPAVNEGIRAMRRRAEEFESPLEATLAGIARVPAARRRLNRRLESAWRRKSRDARRRKAPLVYREVVAGAGLHGNIYASVRHLLGHEPPLLIEECRVGGGHSFATSWEPSFFLNSRNRPGLAGPPNEAGGLNVIPGAPLRMAAISTDKFHTNAELAFVIRVMAALHADVLFGQVTDVTYSSEAVRDKGGPRYSVLLADGRRVHADRFLDARGLGAERVPDGAGSPGARGPVMNSAQLMGLVDSPSPLRGMSRVAVVGGGDSATCAAELLLGASPPGHASVAALDWVRQVDMYCPTLPATREDWRARERGRYQAMGSFLRPLANGEQRLRVFQDAGRVSAGYGMAYVNDRRYDHVVMAVGPELSALGGFGGADYAVVSVAPSLAARVPGEEVYRIGPAAGLALSKYEATTSTGERPEYVSALFRLSDWTAALAAQLK